MEEKRIVKDLTIELQDLHNMAVKCDSYSEAIKMFWFASRKSISNAVYAREKAYQNFWRKVTKTWPDMKGHTASYHKDGTIVFIIDLNTP